MNGPPKIELVECRKHGKQRLSKYCESKNILDAEGAVVGVLYECLPDHCCEILKNAAAVQQQRGGFVTSSAPAMPEELKEAFQKQIGPREARQPRGPQRYYDLSMDNREGSGKKVCYQCGMRDHERGNCNNQLCRACHAIFNPGHICVPVGISPFVVLEEMSPEALKNVRCTVCHQEGHFDCLQQNVRRNRSHSCAFCGAADHHAFDCDRRPKDRWVQAVDAAARQYYGQFNQQMARQLNNDPVRGSHQHHHQGHHEHEGHHEHSNRKRKYRRFDSDDDESDDSFQAQRHRKKKRYY